MKLNCLDKEMRVYEMAHDHNVLPHLFMVARMDGRCFTRLTKEIHVFDKPYDKRFSEMMVETTKHLMSCGFKVIYAYTQSDEISLLIDLSDTTFDRKERKINTILAGEASAKLSVLLNDISVFDCRISQLPNVNLVTDYFRWRSADAYRNALNEYSYWQLQKEGKTPRQINAELSGLSVADKKTLLLQLGVNMNLIPAWQKNGIGLYWETYQKSAINQKTGEAVMATRRRIKVNNQLPKKDEYGLFIQRQVQRSNT